MPSRISDFFIGFGFFKFFQHVKLYDSGEKRALRQRRHWDGRELDEYIITTEGVGAYGETPEEYLCRMETLHELMAVLDTCTEAQRRRFLLYALDGLSLAEIGVLCSCSKVAVYQSVEAVRKKFINFFENRLNE